MVSINLLLTPGDVQHTLSEHFKRARLDKAHSRTKAAELSGVPSATIRKFETSGQISLRQFLMLCHVYGDIAQLNGVFTIPIPQTMDQLLSQEKQPMRQRGRS